MTMAKRGNIADAIHVAAGSTRPAGQGRQDTVPLAVGSASGDTAAASPAPQASRAGTKAITGHFPPQVRYQLRLLAAEQDRKVEDMLAEALNRLFAAYNKPEIAPTAARAK